MSTIRNNVSTSLIILAVIILTCNSQYGVVAAAEKVSLLSTNCHLNIILAFIIVVCIDFVDLQCTTLLDAYLNFDSTLCARIMIKQNMS